MNQRTDVVKAGQHSLPGIVPEADEATDLLRMFSVWEEGRDYVASRVPTSAERQMLQRRLKVLDHALKAFTSSPNDQEAVKIALATFFAGYPSLQNADAKGLVAAYMTDLRMLPRCAIEKGLDDIKHGKVLVSDGRGAQVKMDPDWPPSSPRVYDVAVKAMHAAASEQVKIQKLLRAKAARNDMDLSPEQRTAAAARVKRMADQARGTLREGLSAATAVEREAEEERRQAAAEKQRARWEDDCHAAWERVCMEPMYVGGFLVSPETAARLHPELFTAKDV